MFMLDEDKLYTASSDGFVHLIKIENEKLEDKLNKVSKESKEDKDDKQESEKIEVIKTNENKVEKKLSNTNVTHQKLYSHYFVMSISRFFKTPFNVSLYNLYI